MMRASGQSLASTSGLEPRDEHDLRIWTAIAMWLGGGCAIVAAALVRGTANPDLAGLWGLTAACGLAATFTFLVFRGRSNATLYVLTNIFSTLGALTVWFACLWSGGPSSGLFGLYFIPVLYDAYFFRFKHALGHLAINSALALSPLLYASSLHGSQFQARAVVLLFGMWSMSALVGSGKRRLLMAELDARRRARLDSLTGLHNLRSLRERAASSVPREGTAVIEIDIDDFKSVNTAHGHTGADEFLQAVGAALITLGGEADCVARIGGDEFAMLVHGRSQQEVELLARDCAIAVRRASSVLPGQASSFTASVGYGLWPRDGQTFADLLAAADRHMYRTKAAAAHHEDGARARQDLHLEPAGAGPRPKLGGEGGGAVVRPSAPGKRAAWWAGRPAHDIAAAASWLGGAGITLIVLLLPGTDTAHARTLAGLILGAVGMAAFVLLLAPLIGRRAHLLADVLSVPAVGIGVYLTGGVDSPLLPLVLFAVTVAAWFTRTRDALLCLLGAILVCATPFAYSGDGAQVSFIVRFIAIATTAGVLVAIILYNRRELARAEAEALRLASHDPLTGLPNRGAFRRIASESLRAIDSDPSAVVSMSIIDLDNFKRLNDRHGHAAGDRVLKAIASALGAVTRREDTVARIGGDEFALIAGGADTAASLAVGERCVQAVEKAVIRAGYGDCEVSATVGSAVAPFHGRTLDALVEAADSALMRAKRSGKRSAACADGPAPRALGRATATATAA